MIDIENIFKWEMPSLEKLSAIAVAEKLWGLSDVKNKVYKFFKETPQKSRDKEKWKEIIDYVIKIVDLLIIPVALKSNIKNYVYVVGKLIFDFISHITYHGFDINFGLRIHWGSYGMIDELKMSREWLQESELLASRGKRPLKNSFLCLASTYTDENIIKSNMNKMKRELSECLETSSYTATKWNLYGTLATFLFNRTISSPYLRRTRRINYMIHCKNPDKIPADDMFHLCLDHQFIFAAKYFWDKLNIGEKKLNCVEGAKRCLYGYGTHPYIRQKMSDLMLFFMKEMSDSERLDFISKNYRWLFQAFLITWPHQELCVNIINNVDLKPTEIGGFLTCVIESILSQRITRLWNTRDHSVSYKNKNVYHDILLKLLEKIPKELKETEVRKLPFQLFYEKCDYVLIGLLVNDVDLKQLRDEIISINCLKKSILSNNYDFVNNFLNHVFYNRNEKKSFKEQLNCLEELLIDGQLELATNHLNWLCDSESARESVKAKIDHVKICTDLIKNNKLKLCEKVLSWRFDDKEELENAKKELLRLVGTKNLLTN